MTYAVLRKGYGMKRAGKPLVAVGKPVESLGAHVEGKTVRIETATDATDVVVACSAAVKHRPVERQGRDVLAKGRRGANRWEAKALEMQGRRSRCLGPQRADQQLPAHVPEPHNVALVKDLEPSDTLTAAER